MKSKLINFLILAALSVSSSRADPGLSDAGSLPGFEFYLVAFVLLSIPFLRIFKRSKN